MDFGHISVDCNGRQFAHDVQALAESLVDVGVIRIGIVVIEGQQGVLQFIH